MHPRVAYIGAVVAAGICALTVAAAGLPSADSWLPWLLLSMLVWLSAPLALRVPGAQLTITVSESVSFLIAIAIGWQPAVLTVAVDGLLTSLRQSSRRADRTVFNVAEPALSMAACGLALDWLTGLSPAGRVHAPILDLLIPVFAATSVYLLSNNTLISIAVALESKGSALAIWRRQAGWLVVDHMGATSLALLVVAGADSAEPIGMFAALPLLGTLYVAYRSSIKRAEEALHYAERLNGIYLDTVESLAAAIDAKDQVTHGHITRVRRLALCIARVLGVDDEATTKALEAGALLHDVGKLGVPDHILNKPGPLTAGEYEQVKRHSAVGATIVSRVNYPYPVAPIVRHHHENWDGSGYPDGLRGTAIPLGARILSVIDCYDALTSDRPYRRAMSHDVALQVVAERSGTMYDPAVVQALLSLPRDQTEAAPPAAAGAPDTTGLDGGWAAPATTAAGASAPAHAAAPADATGAVPEAMRRLLGHLLEVTPASTVAVFVPAASGTDLRLWWAGGRAATELAALRPSRGHGLSGWVAAHGSSVVNAPANLELQASTDPAHQPAHALSVPIVFTDGLAGALTLYSDDARFGRDDVELVQALAHALGTHARPAPDYWASAQDAGPLALVGERVAS